MNSLASLEETTERSAGRGPGAVPTGWGQAFPRAVLLSPDGFLVPATTLRVLLAPGRSIPFRYVGFALAPWLRNGDEFVVSAGGTPTLGDLVLCDSAGWGDIRRVVRRMPDKTLMTALDAFPYGRETVAQSRILGIVVSDGKARRASARLIAGLYPLWSRVAALRHWYRKIQEAPSFATGGTESIARKYERQVESYTEIIKSPLAPETIALVRRYVPPGGSVLVPGSGAGREALQLAREGFRVSGFDLVPTMVEASRKNALTVGVDAEFFQGDMATIDLGSKQFNAVYITPLVYSFMQGRGQRVGSLRRLGNHLASGGAVIYSAHLLTRTADVARMILCWLRRRLHGDDRSEFGDWFTWFLTPEGRIGTAFSHRFFKRQVLTEARAAGFRVAEQIKQSQFVAREFMP